MLLEKDAEIARLSALLESNHLEFSTPCAAHQKFGSSDSLSPSDYESLLLLLVSISRKSINCYRHNSSRLRWS